MSRLGKAWRLWAKALGTKEGNTDLEANLVAIIRTILFLAGLVFSLWGAYTNYMIVKGIERHWYDVK